MKTYCLITDNRIVQALDYRDARFKEIVDNIDLSGFTEVDLSDSQVDAIIAGEKLDYVDGRVVPHTPTAEEEAETLDGARARVIAAIEAHDKSAAVNSFTVGGQSMWLDREERTSLARTIAISEAAGAAEFSMWAGGSPPVRFDIPIAMASGMLDELERYAAATYNVTQSHIAAVYALASVAELETYDFTAGYPPKLKFNL